MEKEFVPYAEALELKKLGYIENIENGLKNYGMYCEGVFYRLYPNMGNDIPDNVYREVDAPLYQQAFRWFREKHNLQHELCSCIKNSWLITIMDTTSTTEHGVYNGKRWDCDDLDENIPHTYEEAELECLKKLIEIVKK